MLAAQIERSSNQILTDMKNIYEFKDIIGFTVNSADINQKE